MEGTFSPVTIQTFRGGLVTDGEADALRPSETPDCLNIDFDTRGAFIIRKGFELFGDRDTSAGSILTNWNFRRPIIDDEIKVRQHFDNTTRTLQYYHSGTATWETIPTTGTITGKMGYANYTSSTDTEDQLYLCDGNINLQRWNGGHTQLNGALAGGEATITVDSTTGFATADTINIGGTSVTYTGKTATTFTGCTGTPAAADDLVVTQEADVFSASAGTKPKGKIMVVINGQLAVAEKQFVYLSDADNFTKWSGGLADNKGFSQGTITGLSTKDKKLVVFTKDSVHSIEYEFTGDQTGQQLRVEDIEDTPLFGAKVFTGVTRADGKIFFVGADNIIRDLIRSDVSTLFDTGSISENIKETLLKYTTNNSSAIFFKNKLYFACQSDQSNINDTVFVYDLKLARTNESGESWTKYSLFVNDFVVWDGALHFSSSADPNTYRLFTGSDGVDLYTDDGAAIPWYYTTKQLDFGKPYAKSEGFKFISKGFVSPEAEITYTLLYDYGIKNKQAKVFDGDDASRVLSPVVLSLGEEVVGEEGANNEDPFDGVYPFVYPTRYGSFRGYNLQLKVSGQTKSERYKQTHLIIYQESQDEVMTN